MRKEDRPMYLISPGLPASLYLEVGSGASMHALVERLSDEITVRRCRPFQQKGGERV